MAHLELLGPVARIGLAILLNGLWQGALIAFLTWIALYIFRSANATTRYAVWSLALLAVLIVPVVTSLSRVSVETAPVSHTSLPSTHGSAPVRVNEPAAPAPATRVTSVQHTAVAPRLSLPSLQVHVPEFIAPVIFALWALAALVVLVRLIVAFLALERLKHDSLPLSVEYRDSMPRWMNALKGSRDVRICVSDDIEVPIAVGLFDSMVLLPSHLVHSLDPAEIDQISLHELGHLLRGDDWTNAVQRIACALLFFNPAVWFISRQMDVEREVACDDYVLQLTGQVRSYAFCLTKMAEMTAWPHRPMPAPGVFVTRKNISIRIERLLRTGRAIGSSIAPSVAGSFVAALVAVFIVLRLMTPSIAFTAPAAPEALASPAPPATTAKMPAQPHKIEAKAEKPHVAAAAMAPVTKVAQVATASPTASPTMPATPAPVHHVHQAMPKWPAIPHMVASDTNDANDMPNIGATINRAIKNAGKAVAQAKDVDGCTGCNFADANLSGRDFSNRSMEGANFKNANLQGARFEHSQLTGANFDNADLRNASFRNADLEGCNMRNARLDGANFDGAHLTGCNIDVSKLAPEQARNVINSCDGCNLAKANLNGMDLHGVHLTGMNLEGADLRNVNLSGADLTGANLENAKLAGANLTNADLTGCNLRGADLRGVDLSHTSLTGANMAGAIWKN